MHLSLISTAILSILLPALAASPSVVDPAAYDPLAPLFEESPLFLDLTITDQRRHRDIPLRIYLPHEVSASPVVLFSHGLGGSRETCGYLGEHWASRGYVAVFVQHPGSDESVWSEVPVSERMDSLVAAAGLESFLERVGDVSVVLDRLEELNAEDGHELEGRMDLNATGMSGHSFGAVTTQALCGQRTAGGRSIFSDERLDAAVIMSPSSPRMGTAEQAFGQVEMPWLLMTGTMDDAVIGGADADSRLEVFPALPEGDKYELVLYGAEHSAFTERALPGDRETRNPNHHIVIIAISTAFWDAYLRDDPAALEWLRGGGPSSVLEPDDSWRWK
ncbi:MAG: dienelactone hydrolase [Candidatus Aegiribacteria sp. MLS_C]|nr:MAG: dienelactone hydrolase [Candidatus Aegiribacteria sp. MLS_C]